MNRLQHIGKDRADDYVDLVAFEQFLDLLNGNVRLQGVIGDKQLDILAAHFPAEVLHRKLEAILRLLAEHTWRSRQGVDEADADLILCGGAADGKCKRCKSGERRGYPIHYSPLEQGRLSAVTPLKHKSCGPYQRVKLRQVEAGLGRACGNASWIASKVGPARLSQTITKHKSGIPDLCCQARR